MILNFLITYLVSVSHFSGWLGYYYLYSFISNVSIDANIVEVTNIGWYYTDKQSERAPCLTTEPRHYIKFGFFSKLVTFLTLHWTYCLLVFVERDRFPQLNVSSHASILCRTGRTVGITSFVPS